jgi:hypothetical protein
MCHRLEILPGSLTKAPTATKLVARLSESRNLGWANHIKNTVVKDSSA